MSAIVSMIPSVFGEEAELNAVRLCSASGWL